MTSHQGSATAVKCTLQGSVISAARDSIAFLNVKVVGYPLLRAFIFYCEVSRVLSKQKN